MPAVVRSPPAAHRGAHSADENGDMIMRYLVRTSIVEVVGRIWMPGVTAAMRYELDGYDVENARDDSGRITRDSVQRWLDTHAGDFAAVTDFRASIEDGDDTVEIPWACLGDDLH